MELKIIDVSTHQGVIDWAKVKTQIDGAIIRLGYGKDVAKQDDKMFQKNVEGCISNNIPFGVYLYSYAKDVESAKSEAQHVLRLLNPYKDNISYPVYLDLEEKGTEKGAVERAEVFAEIIEKNGYQCGIYANKYWWENHLKGLEKYTKWVAQYNNKCTYKGTYDMWQYSSKGSVSGISGNVDMNICYKDIQKKKEEPKNSEEIFGFKVGNTYTTQVELKVRTGAGTNYPAKKYSQLTANAKKNDKDKDGAIEKGTKITCLEVKNVGTDVWIRIPSGWIAGYYKGKVYVK